MKQSCFVLLVVFLIHSTPIMAQTFGTRQPMPRPDQYGNVEINNYSENAGIAAVIFRHWLHRARYTCRLCHVDLGFAMRAGQTHIREADIRNGLYCGSCHNGKIAFSAGTAGHHEADKTTCQRCHSLGREIKLKNDFYAFTRGFPSARMGNRVDWLKAEEEGRIQLIDFLEGISIKRNSLELPLDVEIDARVAQMPDIVFSHEKHAVWNGCELCHPQIFAVRKASSVYEMQDIFDGKFCGACHGKVAFMTLECQLCHTRESY